MNRNPIRHLSDYLYGFQLVQRLRGRHCIGIRTFFNFWIHGIHMPQIIAAWNRIFDKKQYSPVYALSFSVIDYFRFNADTSIWDRADEWKSVRTARPPMDALPLELTYKSSRSTSISAETDAKPETSIRRLPGVRTETSRSLATPEISVRTSPWAVTENPEISVAPDCVKCSELTRNGSFTILHAPSTLILQSPEVSMFSVLKLQAPSRCR